MRSSGLGFGSIERLLERRGSNPAIGVEKSFGPVRALGQVGFDDGFDRVHDLVGAETPADDLAERGILVCGTAKRHLVKFRSLLLHTENADMADMVVPAGIDAAGDVELQFTYVAMALQRGEPLCDLLIHGNRTRIGQRAKVEPGAGNYVGDELDTGNVVYDLRAD